MVTGTNMLLGFIFVCIASIAAKHSDIPCFRCLKVDSFCYNSSFVFELDGRFNNTIVVTKMGYLRLRSENRLYFAFDSAIADPEYYKIGFVNLDKLDESGIVTGSKAVNNFVTFYIDKYNDIVFVGGSDGIYYLDVYNNAINFRSSGESIKSLFVYNGRVLYVREGENNILEKKYNESALTYGYEGYGNVRDFVVIKNYIIIFLNSTGLYVNKFKTNKTVYLSRDAPFRGLTVDSNGVVFTWSVDYLYKVVIDSNIEYSKLIKVADIWGLGAVTFDKNNNILFSSGKNVFRLSLTTPTAC